MGSTRPTSSRAPSSTRMGPSSPGSPAASQERPPVREDSVVALRPLEVVREPGRDPIVGCREVRAFVEVGEETLAALDAIRATPDLAVARRRLEASTGNA